VDDQEYEVDFDTISEQPMHSLLLDGQSYEAYVYTSEKIWQVLLFGRFYPDHVEDERERRLRLAAGSTVSQRTEYYLKAPMPGLVVNIPVTEGQEVEDGDVLVVFESMKMQNELRSPRPGRVTGLRIEEGDSVEQHTILLSVV
jgi:acetyl/propionyl-CoA carboxylase alpha subunit